jgi:hypothetical protein
MSVQGRRLAIELDCQMNKRHSGQVCWHTIKLSEDERDDEIYTEDILPYLETNLYRPRVVVVKKTIARPFPEKVLGRALHCVKSNPNLVWMFLSENVDVFVCSKEEDTREVAVSAVATAVVVAVVAGCKRKRKRNR